MSMNEKMHLWKFNYIISIQSKLTNLIQDKIYVQIKVYPLLLFEEILFLTENT
jgi:hypothetical protein